MHFPISIAWWVFSSNITCALPTESIDLGGSICIVLTPGDSKFRPVLSTRAAGFIGERCFQSLVFLLMERRRCLLYMGLEEVGPCSPLTLCCSSLGASVWGESTCRQERKTSQFGLHAGAHYSWISPFQKVGISRSFCLWIWWEQVKELCWCHWRHILKILMWFLNIISMRKQPRAGGRRGENGSFSGKRPVRGQRPCLLFLLKCHGLRTCKPFIFYFWCSCLARLFSAACFSPSYDSQSALYNTSPRCSRAFSPLSASRLPTEHGEFSPWINDFQLLKLFLLWKINMGSH